MPIHPPLPGPPSPPGKTPADPKPGRKQAIIRLTLATSATATLLATPAIQRSIGRALPPRSSSPGRKRPAAGKPWALTNSSAWGGGSWLDGRFWFGLVCVWVVLWFVFGFGFGHVGLGWVGLAVWDFNCVDAYWLSFKPIFCPTLPLVCAYSRGWNGARSDAHSLALAPGD
jgi:hypothetical protein